MNVLCKIGIHKWRVVGFVGLAMPAELRQCERCEVGRANHFNYVETFSAELMREAVEQDRARLAGRGEKGVQS